MYISDRIHPAPDNITIGTAFCIVRRASKKKSTIVRSEFIKFCSYPNGLSPNGL